MKIEIIDEIEFLRKTKTYTIEINDKEVEVKKTWYINDMTDEYGVDYEVENEDKLTDEERDELSDFIDGLE
jgi:hypothetical protein